MTAASPGPAPVTPGRAAYEAFRASQSARLGPQLGAFAGWGALEDYERACWEAAARAATENSTAWRIAARELERERDEARAKLPAVADAANVVFDLFTRGSDGWHARISGVNLMRAYKAIGRPVPGYLSHLEGQ